MAASFIYYEYSDTTTSTARNLITDTTDVGATSALSGVLQLMVRVISPSDTDMFVVDITERVKSTADSGSNFGPWRLSASNDRVIAANILVHNNWVVTVHKEAGTDRVVESSLRIVTS